MASVEPGKLAKREGLFFFLSVSCTWKQVPCPGLHFSTAFHLIYVNRKS